MIGVLHPLVFFPTYEKMKIYFKTHFEPEDAPRLSSKYIFVASTLSKVFSSFVSYPHEVLRSRL